MKCKYCGSETLEEPQDFAKDYDPYDLVYGDCQHRCTRCGSIGYEIFGHGISWRKGMFNKINEANSSMAVQCDAKEKCSLRHTTSCDTCKHNRGGKKNKNCYIPQ